MRRPPSRCALAPALLALCFAWLAGAPVHAQTTEQGDAPLLESPPSDALPPAAATVPDEGAREAAAGGVSEGLDDERARAHFSAGESHYAAERFADAAREFALAYELSRRPEMLVNLARAHEREGALRAAVADLELLLLQHPTASYRGEAEQRLAELRERLAAPPADARLPSFETTMEPPTRELESTRLPAWPRYVLAASAVASAAVALGSGVRAHRIYQQLEQECRPNDECVGPFADDRDRGRALARASTGMTFAAVVLGGAAAALWLYDMRAKRRKLSLDAHLDGRSAALQLRGRF